MQGGNVSIAGCPMKRAMPWLIWSLINPTYLRANPLSMIQFFVRFSFSQTWHGVKPRTPLPNISSISLSCCCMAPAIWMGRSTLLFSLGLWSDLCCDVQCIMIRFYSSEDYSGSGFMSCCFLMGFSSQQITSVIFLLSSVIPILAPTSVRESSSWRLQTEWLLNLQFSMW